VKKVLLLILIISFINLEICYSEEVHKETPSWVYVISIGTLVTIGYHWYYTNYINPQRPIEKCLKDSVWEEIKYIAKQKEKKDFKRLKEPEEIKAFLEKFWSKRDPYPETVLNEFKIEYYKRIQYANNYFPSAFKKGFKSDRGRVYILYGQPDEIERYPWTYFGMGGTNPREIERYPWPNFGSGVENNSNSNKPISHSSSESIGSNVYSIEVWLYYKPAGSFEWPNLFSNIHPNGMKFIFADLKGYGKIEQIYSSESGEKIDPRVYQKLDE